MNCSICGHIMQLQFSSNGFNAGKFFWACTKYPNCKGTYEYKPRFTNFIGQKGMGYVIKNMLNEFNPENKQILLDDIQGQMIEILRHYLWCQIESCYTSIYRFILIDHLVNEKVLDYFLKSEAIKNGPQQIVLSSSGSKIFYDLFYDFMLVKSNKIKNYLKTEFPDYYNMFRNHILPKQQYEFIDYEKNTLKDIP